MSVIEPKARTCTHCDFGSGYRGMDSCGKCQGVGSVFYVNGKIYMNTKEGYRAAVYALNDPELAREET